GQEVLGKHIHFLGETWDVAIVGEVNTVKYATLGEAPQPIVYLPLKQHYSAAVSVFVRTKSDPAAATATVRSTMKDLAPFLPLLRMQTMQTVLENSPTAPRRFSAPSGNSRAPFALSASSTAVETARDPSSCCAPSPSPQRDRSSFARTR